MNFNTNVNEKENVKNSIDLQANKNMAHKRTKTMAPETEPSLKDNHPNI